MQHRSNGTILEFDFTDVNEHDVLTLFNPSGVPLPYSLAELRQMIDQIEEQEGVSFEMIEVVFLPSDEMIRMNREHKNHDYLTDILTFPYHEEGDDLEATLYCCPERIQEQAREWDTTLPEEFRRVFIHGLLHLCGYNDGTEQERSTMRHREHHYLKIWDSL